MAASYGFIHNLEVINKNVLMKSRPDFASYNQRHAI